MNAKALVALAVLVLTAVVGCGTTTTAGRPAPVEPAATATSPPATTAPPTTAAPSKYTPAEWAFLAAYPTMNPDAALHGGYAICTSLKAGITQPQIIESIRGMAGIDLESAKKVVFAATTCLCPR
ncbi:DUF732 domain-containing protein [Pseudonocardia adelaidensis]|uniref:DUF732 domain-containing protein n=1 Tax=Pseudonocardia adelaidensis TaxID=648754 RepID=A0ABP9NNB6_9PSEU